MDRILLFILKFNYKLLKILFIFRWDTNAGHHSIIKNLYIIYKNNQILNLF